MTDTETLIVHGEVVAGFEAVRDAFAEHVADVGKGGAAFAAVIDGELVVDLWAGFAGVNPWQRETRGVIMSATKGVAATAVACLVDRGLIDVEAPVANYWPEFRAGDKGGVTVAHVLSHAAGLPTIPGYEDILTPDGVGWNRTEDILRRLESAVPEWQPGSTHGYHGLTYGWLLGEIVRRASGVSIGTVIRDEIVIPLGLELDLGTPVEKHDLVAPVLSLGPKPPTVAALNEQITNPELFSRMALTVDGRSVIDAVETLFADPAVLMLELPGSNATATARALATLYGALANGGRHGDVWLLSPETIALFAAERVRGGDWMTGAEGRYALGFQRPVSASSRTYDKEFGHAGLGGQFGFANPVRQVGVGFVRSHLSWNAELTHRFGAMVAPREFTTLGRTLVDSLYECVDAS